MGRGRTQQIHNNNDDDHIADGHKFIASLANNSNNDGNLAICPVRCLTPNRKYQVEGSLLLLLILFLQLFCCWRYNQSVNIVFAVLLPPTPLAREQPLNCRHEGLKPRANK